MPGIENDDRFYIWDTTIPVVVAEPPPDSTVEPHSCQYPECNEDNWSRGYCRSHATYCGNCATYGAEQVFLGFEGSRRQAHELCHRCRRVQSRCIVCNDESQAFIYDSGRGQAVGVCSHEHADSCDGCNRLHDTVDLNEDGLCPDCAENSWTCVECGETYPPTRSAVTEGYDGYVCGDCAVYCDQCDEYHRAPECAATIHGWSYTPPLTFHPDYHQQDNKLYLGFELEAELEEYDSYHLNTIAQDIQDRWGEQYLWLKFDGSLGCGFEAVTHPFDPEWALNGDEFPWEAFDHAAEQGMRSYKRRSCGLHIHLSKDAFTPPHLWKFLQFHYRNAAQIQTLARRGSTDYAEWMPDHERRNTLKYAKKESANTGRYVAVNLQPDHTIELRYWQGTLKVSSLQRAVRTVWGLYLYTRDLTVPQVRDGGLEFRSFRKWASEWHPDLSDFLSEADI